MHLGGVGFDADVANPASSNAVAKYPGPPPTSSSVRPDRRLTVSRLPQVADHRGGVGGQRAVEPRRVALLEAELPTAAAPTGDSVARRAKTSVAATANPRPTVYVQRLRWAPDVSAAPYAPCCCCAGATPATPRAAAARPTCSASARSWPRPVSTSRCAPPVMPGAPARRGGRRGADQPGGRPLLGLHLGGAGDGAGPHRPRPAAPGAPRRGRSTPRTACRSWPGWLTAGAWWCWCTTATASSGRWPGR